MISFPASSQAQNGRVSTNLRTAIAWALFSFSIAIGQASPQSTAAKQSPQDLVDALHSAFGDHHARAVHAKGVMLQGTFEAASGAGKLSKAPIFAATGKRPVVVRFSDFTGIPDIPDNTGDASPRGFAFKITLPDGSTTDVVTHSFNGFPVATSDQFAELLHAIAASATATSHPSPIEQFLSNHPVAKAFLTSQRTPTSYATATYFGVNSFKFTNGLGKAVYVRYRLIPRAGESYLSSEDLKKRGANFLRDEVSERIAKGPIVFDWYAQIAEDGDKIEDPSIAWPEDRKLVKLGAIKIDKLVDDPNLDKQTMFLPGDSQSGIAPADPMLILRNKAYPISFRNRQ